MSGFPSSSAPLTDATFNTCYQMLPAQLRTSLQVEYPPLERGRSGYESGQSDNSAYVHAVRTWMPTLNQWVQHATDGDPATLPTASGAATPWDHLGQAASGPLTRDLSTLDTIRSGMQDSWTGAASDGFRQYLTTMQTHLRRYVGDTETGATYLNGMVGQAAGALLAAFSVHVAFKKDLLELARGTYTALGRSAGPWNRSSCWAWRSSKWPCRPRPTRSRWGRRCRRWSSGSRSSAR